jgi:Zn-dependent peptidase ImmA (M78 family)
MSPSRPRYQLVERVAADLLRRTGVISPAVPIEDLIRGEGIELRYPDLGGEVSGVLVRQEGGMVIGVNRRHVKTRQRFTAAHELGHALLHKGTEVHHDAGFRLNLRSDRSSKGIDPEEVEANHFAACILMPRAFVEADPNAFLVDAEDATTVALLARSYHVSAHAMGLRLASLAGRRG